MSKKPAKKSRGKKPSFFKKLRSKYRLLVLNEDTFEEKFSYKLSRLNVFLAVVFLVIFLISTTTLFIALTPLKEYIPGYESTELRIQAIENAYLVDSLERNIQSQQRFLQSITRVLNGDLDLDSLNHQLNETIPDTLDIDLAMQPSEQDSLLRIVVDQEDKYNLLESASAKVNFMLYAPVTGTISQVFDPATQHFAVDVVVPKNTPIKSVADGTVVLASWSVDTGYVVLVEHPYGLTSVYKHNASLAVAQGDRVLAGEVIATAGNTGEFSTGPHLHFELWNNGYPVDPTAYIDFE